MIYAGNPVAYEDVPPGRYVIRGQPNASSDDQRSKPLTIELKGGKTTDVTLPANGEGYGRPMAIWLHRVGTPRPTKNQRLPEREHTALCGSYNPLYGLEQCRKRARLRDINFVRQNLCFWRQTTLQAIVVIASYSL